MESYLTIYCPHCNDIILINYREINCRIFRHGVFKNTFEQIPPHSSKLDCDKFISDDIIYGCGKPFRLNEQNEPVICDYI